MTASERRKAWTVRFTGILVAACVGAVLGASDVEARQGVLFGFVTDDSSGVPVVGAVVGLVDAEGTARVRVLSGPDGRYTVRAPHAGSWTVRVTSLGYAAWDRTEIEVADATQTRLDIAVRPAPLAVAGIEAAAASDRRCAPLGTDDGTALVRLWEQARASLELAAWSQEDAGFQFLLRRHEREIDPGTGDVIAERHWNSPATRRPFESLTAEELNVVGWARYEEPSRVAGPVLYDAPDPEALLSDAFQRDYCFGVRIVEDDPTVVAVTFEPERAGPPVGLIGELWMDRETAGLRRLTVRHTGHPGFTDRTDGPDLPEPTRRLLGGEATFQTLASGAVVVSEWSLRMPLGTSRGVLVREVGGELRHTLLPGGAVAPGPRGGVIEGIVRDGARGGAPLAGVRVRLTGTDMVRSTDAAGRFRFVLDEYGSFELEVERALDEATGEAVRVPVELGGGEVVSVDVAVSG
jgi:hypothetical protein